MGAQSDGNQVRVQRMAEEASAQFPVKTEEIRQNKKIPINLPAKGQARPPSFAVGRERIEGWLTGRWWLFTCMICSEGAYIHQLGFLRAAGDRLHRGARPSDVQAIVSGSAPLLLSMLRVAKGREPLPMRSRVRHSASVTYVTGISLTDMRVSSIKQVRQ
jgi:hypothetical protein